MINYRGQKYFTDLADDKTLAYSLIKISFMLNLSSARRRENN